MADDQETLDDNESLLELNAAAFAAEAHEPVDSWADVLNSSLGEDFRLRRAIGEMEDRERMITRLSRSKPVTRELFGDPEIAVLANTALVCSRVRVGSGTFHNAKLFDRTPDGLRCVYWRVTRTG